MWGCDLSLLLVGAPGYSMRFPFQAELLTFIIPTAILVGGSSHWDMMGEGINIWGGHVFALLPQAEAWEVAAGLSMLLGPEACQGPSMCWDTALHICPRRFNSWESCHLWNSVGLAADLHWCSSESRLWQSWKSIPATTKTPLRLHPWGTSLLTLH